MQQYNKLTTESYDDYFVRLFENKDAYKLTCTDIANLLNQVNGQNKGECAYRKQFKNFQRGRMYERRKNSAAYRRILSISDLHIPFQKPVSVFSKYAGKIDILQINGDVMDNAAISKFSKAFRSSVMDDIIEARNYLIELITLLSPSKVVILYGNHDLRFENYLAKNLNSDLIELMPKTPIELIVNGGFTRYDKLTRSKTWYEPLRNIFPDIEIEYNDSWHCQIGETIFCHPLAYSSGIMKTSEKAMLYFRNEGYKFTSLVMGHIHRIGYSYIGNTQIFEQGACCNTSLMQYNDGKLVNSQKEGYLYLEQSAAGELKNYHQEILEKGFLT